MSQMGHARALARDALLAGLLTTAGCSHDGIGLSHVRVGPATLRSGGQPTARLVLDVRLDLAASRTYVFAAEVVGGSDNDQSLYCAAITWGFGDGPPLTVSPSCSPWTPD